MRWPEQRVRHAIGDPQQHFMNLQYDCTALFCHMYWIPGIWSISISTLDFGLYAYDKDDYGSVRVDRYQYCRD